MSSSLPRILCLHGGGANARVFRLQCRALIERLAPSLRLVFVDAPFDSAPHAAVALVYGDCGPFGRWLRHLPEHQRRPAPDGGDGDDGGDGAVAAARRSVAVCRRAMADDDGTGAWVGVLGFSQGAKVAASLLWAQQRAPAAGLDALTPFRFGVLMAGSPPIVWLDDRVPPPPRHVADAALPVGDFDDWPDNADGGWGPHTLAVPTLHVHGLRDPGLPWHRQLLKAYCRPGTARLVEWPGDHRLPLKTDDVEAVAKQILALARETGATTT